jgi:hypothetical protein
VLTDYAVLATLVLLQARNNKSRRSQPAPAAGQSALLQFLEKLDEDTFCQTLLPMLIENESAGDLAATCSQLRQLCHSSIKKLDLRALLRDDVQPSDAEQWTQHLQEHFPQCSSVVLQVEDSESYQALNYMLPALARWADNDWLCKTAVQLRRAARSCIAMINVM